MSTPNISLEALANEIAVLKGEGLASNMLVQAALEAAISASSNPRAVLNIITKKVEGSWDKIQPNPNKQQAIAMDRAKFLVNDMLKKLSDTLQD